MPAVLPGLGPVRDPICAIFRSMGNAPTCGGSELLISHAMATRHDPVAGNEHLVNRNNRGAWCDDLSSCDLAIEHA